MSDKEWDDFISKVKPLNKSNNTSDIKEIINKKIELSQVEEDISIRSVKLNLLNNQNKSKSLEKISRSEILKIKSKKVTLSSKIDLHSLTLNEAFTAFYNFIHKSYISNYRYVLVITGKGLKSKIQGNLTINESLFVWMNHNEIRPLLTGYSYALNIHGGQGAFYIRIKNKNS